MRKLLFLAIILYDIVVPASRVNNYDYDDLGTDVSKRHHILDDKRRDWRRKANMKSDIDRKEWEDRRRHDYDNRYFDDMDKNFALEKGGSQDRNIAQQERSERGMGQDRGIGQDRGMNQDRGIGQDRRLNQDRGMPQERSRDRDNEINYRHRYEDEKLNMALGGPKSAEIGHLPPYSEKEPDKKPPLAMSCERPHERYEACFAGCASVSCDNPRDRLRPCYPFCEPGCVCVPPYVRDDRTHKCVLPDDCTKGLKGIPDLGDES